MNELLAVIEQYYDAVPRTAAHVEDLHPFTLFIQRGAGWQYYARPSLGATRFTAQDVSGVRARQRALGVPEAFEWVAEVSPDLRAAAEAAGLAVATHPLLVLDTTARQRVPAPAGVDLRLVAPEDDLAFIGAVARLGFASPGTAIGVSGVEDLAPLAAERTPESLSFERERLQAGWTIMAAAVVEGVPVGVGSHQPVGTVSEVVGVATLPAFRRRGIAAALTSLLVEDAIRRGVKTLFLSAGDAAVARIYERVGFRRIGTACIAAPPTPAAVD